MQKHYFHLLHDDNNAFCQIPTPDIHRDYNPDNNLSNIIDELLPKTTPLDYVIGAMSQKK